MRLLILALLLAAPLFADTYEMVGAVTKKSCEVFKADKEVCAKSVSVLEDTTQAPSLRTAKLNDLKAIVVKHLEDKKNEVADFWTRTCSHILNFDKHLEIKLQVAQELLDFKLKGFAVPLESIQGEWKNAISEPIFFDTEASDQKRQYKSLLNQIVDEKPAGPQPLTKFGAVY